MRLLFIEDNERLTTFAKKGLEKEGFTVDVFSTVSDGEAALETVQYDAIILDLGLPDGDGLTLLRSMRDRGNATPVLILTARDDVEDRVMGLDSGGDDYLLKPFAMEELVARIRALLRRPGGALGVTLSTGNISLDTIGREVSVNGVPISISRREMAVLEQLLRRSGRVVPKDVLEDKIYGFEEEVSSNSVEVHISRLRKRLAKAEASICIHTLRGIGYLLSEEEQ
ncbi:MAG: response regulator transcription factor [Rhodospirillales bacterium]